MKGFESSNKCNISDLSWEVDFRVWGPVLYPLVTNWDLPEDYQLI